MKPTLTIYAKPEDDFLVLGIADLDNLNVAGFFFVKVLEPLPAPPSQQPVALTQQQLQTTIAPQPPAPPEPVEVSAEEHARRPGAWYEHTGFDVGNKPTVEVVQDQDTMARFDLILLAHGLGKDDERNKDEAPDVSHPAFQFMQNLAGAATAVHQGAPPPPPAKPNQSTLQSLVDMLKNKPALPPPPPPPPPPVAVEVSNAAFDSALDDLEDFLNDARSKAGGL